MIPRSHYCQWDAPGGRLVRALCGALIRRREHANAPTCETCAKLLARRDAETLDLFRDDEAAP